MLIRNDACWSQLEALFGEWWHRIMSRYELETRIEAFNEIQKPFWQK